MAGKTHYTIPPHMVVKVDYRDAFNDVTLHLKNGFRVNAEKLVNEVTALLMENGCTINKSAMYELAIYIIEREKGVS